MQNFFIYVLLILSVFLTSCASKEKFSKKAGLHHQMALSLMQKCQYPLALVELRKALKLREKEPLFHHSIALLYFQFKKYKKTIEHLKTALKLKPDFTDARVHLGRSLIETGKWEKGLAELKKAKEDLTYRYGENIHIHIGMAYYKRKDFAQAERNFSVVRVVRKKDCFTSLYHAKSLYFQGYFQKALDILEPSKTWCEKDIPVCSSPSFDSYFFAAVIYNKRGQRQKAIFNLQIFLNKAKDSEHLAEAKKNIKLWKKKGLN